MTFKLVIYDRTSERQVLTQHFSSLGEADLHFRMYTKEYRASRNWIDLGLPVREVELSIIESSAIERKRMVVESPR